MKYKKFMLTAAIAALLLAIAYVALYYKSNTEQELTSKRNAILDYLKKINETSSNKTFITENVSSH